MVEGQPTTKPLNADPEKQAPRNQELEIIRVMELFQIDQTAVRKIHLADLENIRIENP